MEKSNCSIVESQYLRIAIRIESAPKYSYELGDKHIVPALQKKPHITIKI